MYRSNLDRSNLGDGIEESSVMNRENRASRRMRRLLERCGLAGERAFAAPEALENRVLLADDHPNFLQVFNTQTPAPVVNVGLNGQGIGAASGVIDYAQDNDIFRFTAPTTDFVTLWADTINEETGVSVLDSKIQVYRRNPDGTAVFVTGGSGGDLLTGGVNTDGWVGFVAQAGTEYFVRVLSDVSTGARATGAYVLRVDAQTTALTLNASTGEVTQAGSITLVGGDVVFRFTTGSDGRFNSLMTFGDRANPNDFDSRLDIYNAQGQRIAFDSEAGRLTNPYVVARGAQNTTYYVRVRGDEFNPASAVAAGNFNLAVDAAAERIGIDPVTRQGATGGTAGGNLTYLYDFIAEGTGLTFVTVVPAGLPPLTDPAVHLYSDTGVQVAFNDDYQTLLSAQLELQLTGGSRYYVVVEGFDVAGAGGFFVVVEANHNILNGGNQTGTGVDDHVDTPPTFNPQQPPAPGTPEYEALRRQFALATPLVFGQPRLFTDPAGNFIGDRSFVVDAYGTGRVFDTNDTDLFQFVPPVDMLGSYTGNNDDIGTSLYAGGAFLTAGNITTSIRGSGRHVAAWDANDWWPARRGVNGTIYGMTSFDFDGDQLEELYVVGDFTTAGNTADPNEDITVNNIARFAFDPIAGDFLWSAVGNGLNGPAYAVTIYDAEAPQGGGEDPPPQLVVGGAFTNPGSRVATWDPDAGWGAIGNFNNTVYAFTTIDYPDPDGQAATFEDLPTQLVIGGAFTQVGGLSANRIVLWDPDGGFLQLGNAATNGANGIVRALTTFTPLDEEADGPTYLVAGGEFTTVDDQRPGVINASRVARFGVLFNGVSGEWDGGLGWSAMGAGISGGAAPVVHALALFDPETGPGGEDPDPVVVAGGSFTNPGSNIAQWNGTGWQPLAGGVNGPVHALSVFADEDEVGLFGNDQVLYVGGDFTQADGEPATRVAKWEYNPSPLVDDFVWAGLETGVDATVYALDGFDDGNPNLWDRHDRHATRLQIVLSPDGGSFLNSFIRIFDSNFTLLYTNETIAPPFPDPSGMLDPSLTIAQLNQIQGITLWGGQTYYIEVSNSTGLSGRYTMQVTADAFVEDDANSTIVEPTEAGTWSEAVEIIIDSNNGDSNNFLSPLNTAHTTRSYQTTGSGVVIDQISEFGQLNVIDDTDLFFFRAPEDGTAEIRLNTSFITDQFVEFFNGIQVQSVDTSYNSPLDGVLRIFNNDFEQIALSDDAAALDGEFTTEDVGTLLDRRFYRRDPRIVIPVVAGERYFIQVESAFLEQFQALNFSEIEWRNATGSFELLINTMPNLQGIDDHENNIVELATVIGIDEDQNSAGNGSGVVLGEIDHVPVFNAFDTDVFTFLAPADGTGRITVTPTTGTLRPWVRVFDEFFLPVTEQRATSPGQAVSVNVAAVQGVRFYVLVLGNDVGEPETEGAYTLAVSDLPYTDDHGSLPKWFSATEIHENVYDYDGTETLSGSIEHAGDVDVFKFTTISFGMARVLVDGQGSFDSFVRVFEVSEDPQGSPVLLQIGFNDDITPGSNLDSRVDFSTTAPDRISSLSGQTYNYYYIVVSGFDPETTNGDYTLTLTVNRTDDHPDEDQFTLATPITINGPTGLGSASGVIEEPGDTDLLTFTSGASGSAIITITSPVSSLLRQGVRIFDQNFAPVTDLISGQQLVLGNDQPISTAVFRFNAVRNATYYIQIQGGPLNSSFLNKIADFGAYAVSITAPTLDDHANAGEFPFSTNIPLSIISGDGQRAGTLSINTDTDLFNITTIADGPVRIVIDTPGSFFTPVLALFRGNQTQIGSPVTDGGPGDEDGLLNGSVTRTIDPTVIGQTFYMLVSSSPFGFATTGAYTITVLANEPPHFPPDDYADENEWADAHIIQLASINGDATVNGGIQFNGDTDLFQFTSAGTGRAFVQVVTPAAQALDLAVRVFNQNQQEIAFDVAGVPGANANVSFNTIAGQKYYVLVTPTGDGEGDYTVRLDAVPETHFLYYPEGFASPSVREFVALVNPNTTTVRYTIRLRYEDPSLPEVVVANNATLAAGRRGGVTISDGSGNPLHGIQFNKPFAIVIESTGPLGATLAHYDFGTTLGEQFTARTSTSWSFARAERFPGGVRDFVLFYNPNPTAVVVTMTAYAANGTTVTFNQTVQGLRRGGWDLNQLTSLPLGTFAVRLTSAPAAGGQNHLGIVASLSHYDLVNVAGDARLGDPDGGSIEGVVLGVVSGSTAQSAVSIFNPGNTTTSVTIHGTYVGSGLPGFTRVFNVAAGRSLHLTNVQLGLAQGQTVGLRWTSNAAVSVSARVAQNTDADSTNGVSVAAQRWLFADGFLSTGQAGIQYFDNLYFYNPDAQGLSVDVRIIFTNGDTATTSVFVNGNGFGRLALHQLTEILSRSGNQFYALDVSAARPFNVSMTHYDLFLGGGWGMQGVPVGLTNPLTTIG